MLPEISVIITFHNQKQFADDCLDNFIRQTIKVPYEIIAIDDASTDDLKDYISKKYPQVNYYKVDFHNANKSRNYGLKKAKGNYIVWFDGDDWPYYNYLEGLYQAIKGYDVACSRFHYQSYGLEHQRLPACNSFEWNPELLDYIPLINTPSLIKREIADKLHWDEKLSCRHDYDINFQLRKLGAKVNLVKKNLWHYRVNSASIWGSGKAMQEKEAAFEYLAKKWNVRREKIDTTFVSMICRSDTLKEYFTSLTQIKMPREKMHWFIFIDSDDDSLVSEVKKYAFKFNFHTTRIFVTGEKNLNTAADFYNRGMRVARNLKTIINDISRPDIYTPYIFEIEDDTIAPPDAYVKLRKLIKKCSYASGVEASRCQDRHLGVGWLTEENGEITKRYIPPPRQKGISEINSGGWYCWMGRTDILKKINFRCVADGRFLGPDSLMVYDLWRSGEKCLIDWSIACQHYDPASKTFINLSEGKGMDIIYLRRGDGWRASIKEINGAF